MENSEVSIDLSQEDSFYEVEDGHYHGKLMAIGNNPDFYECETPEEVISTNKTILDRAVDFLLGLSRSD